MRAKVSSRAGSVAALVASLMLVTAPAYAGTSIPSPTPVQTGPSPTLPGPGGGTDSGGPAYGQAGNCSVVSSASYLGLSCGDGSLTRKSVKQTLGSDPVPGCWDDKLTDAELSAMELDNRDGQTWYWERCLKGIDPKTKKIQPGGVHFTVGVISKGPGDKIVTLTHNQQQLVNMYNRDGTIPSPVAGVSPISRPRVNSDVSFFDGTDDTVSVDAGGVVLSAKVTRIDIEPLGKGIAPKLTCSGIGYKAQPGDTEANHPAGCWYSYKQSSADQPQNAYPANITAHWAVSVTYAGVTTPFNTFEKSQITTVPVAEIQAIVVQ